MMVLIKRLARWLLSTAFRLSLFLVDAAGMFIRGHLGLVRPIDVPASALPAGELGISIIIPERANPELLDESLKSALAASREVQEPVEIIVVVNGSDRDVYSKLQTMYASVRWVFFKQPLWFTGAVQEGLTRARYAWVYLLNNDMVLDRLALRELLRWRAGHVFAVASQIYFKDGNRRREETGWTNYRIRDSLLEIFDQPPDDSDTVRGTLYAGGGSSLFQKKLLQQIMGRANPYHPFYWEDVEWGIRAWKLGYESLFCPASIVWHSHKATNRKIFAAEEIDRIFRRNGYLFQARNPIKGVSRRRLCSAMAALDRRSFLELATPAMLWRALVVRLLSFRYPFEASSLEYVTHKYYLAPMASLKGRPVVLMVSPYCIYPSAHGGAVRLHRLILSLGKRFNVIVLSDEVDGYSEESRRYFTPLCSLHLVGGRVEPSEGRHERMARVKHHAHHILEEQLRMLVANYQPALVQIEFVELAKLAKAKSNGVPWFLTLHDVLLSEDAGNFSEADHYELNLIRQYDHVIACCAEDARLLRGRNVSIIPNGMDMDGRPYIPSTSRRLLFMGPFRYAPNLNGIQVFLRDVYPALKRKIPELELWILGGKGAPDIAANLACFRQRGVTVFDFIEDTRSVLDACTLTINPLLGVRGSCLKLIESLAAGRVCVSTLEGGRGFLNLGLRALVVVKQIQDFEDPLVELLLNPARRLSLEQTPQALLAQHTWKHSGELLTDLYWRTAIQRGTPG